MSDYDLDTKMPALDGKPLRREAEDGEFVDWKVGEAMASALITPGQTDIRPDQHARRLLLATRLYQCGSQRLTTEDRHTIKTAAGSAFGVTFPIVAGRIQQFIEREGPYEPARASAE